MKRYFWIIIPIVAGLIILSIHLINRHKLLYDPVVHTEDYLLIPTGSKITDVDKLLSEKGIDTRKFLRVSEIKKYKKIFPGRYKLEKGMNYDKLLNNLRIGIQEPLKLKLTNIRSIYQLAGQISSQIEADSAEIIRILNDSAFLAENNLNKENVLVIFIPDTYEFYWNTSSEQFIKKMLKYHKTFWNEERIAKAGKIGLRPEEITILASIVQLETTKSEEMSIIAKVYLNRLRAGIPLQADPTVIFAINKNNISNDPIQRVLNSQLQFDSPYNTYKYSGLPPGPICIPNSSVVDKTLNHANHNYIYFCAKDDLSGYHNFTASLSEHQLNAIKYRRAISRMGIYK